MGLMAHLRQFVNRAFNSRVFVLIPTSLFLIVCIHIVFVSSVYAHSASHTPVDTGEIHKFFFTVGAAFIGAILRVAPYLHHPLIKQKDIASEALVLAGLAMISVMILSQTDLLIGFVSGYVVADLLCRIYITSEGGDSHA